MFQGRKLLIATKHQKEKVIAPIVEQALGVQCFTDLSFDTDLLGTFTGEIEREEDPLSTLRKKCLQAMKVSDCDLAISSEGSFGAHPGLYFVPTDDELLIFKDLKNNLEIIVRELSTSTNFNAKQIHNEKELLDFANQIQFPSHGLILRKSSKEYIDIHKGIIDQEVLLYTFHLLCSKYNSVYAETDMRAMYNPTRMKVIEKAAKKLILKIQSLCPDCNMPGFDITDSIKGLPCMLCGLPTRSIKSYVYTCNHCCFSQVKMYPNNKTTEDPMYCDYCNP